MIEYLLGMHLACTGGAATEGTPPSSPEYWVKGGENVERIIRLVKAVTELLRVIAEIIRLFKS